MKTLLCLFAVAALAGCAKSTASIDGARGNVTESEVRLKVGAARTPEPLIVEVDLEPKP